MKIVLVGANGTIGKRIVEALTLNTKSSKLAAINRAVEGYAQAAAAETGRIYKAVNVDYV